MKYYLIAGEFSGDIHASNLMKCLKKEDKNADFRFIGGDKMLEQGGSMLKHYKEMAFMGFWEVAKRLRTIKKNMEMCKNDILDFQPDVVILVDYPGFNLRIAEFTHIQNLKTVYYISPKIWAWKKARVKKIKRFIDKMFVIFPFEVDFYKQYDYQTVYLGNPTLDIVKNELEKDFDSTHFRIENNLPEQKEIIALLPGSRLQEVEKILPEMIEVAKYFKDYQFVIAGVNNLPADIYKTATDIENISVIFDKTYDLFRISKAAVVTSGTATLETALFRVPQVVCYKTSKLSYTIGKAVVKIKWFSLVNILLQKESVKELLQKNLANEIINELDRIIHNDEYQKKIQDDYNQLEKLLGEKGSPCKTAKNLVEFLS